MNFFYQNWISTFLIQLLVCTQLVSEEIALGDKHSLLLSGSNIITLGNDDFGQLGDSGSGMVDGSNVWMSVATGAHHSLALDENLNVWAWGLNSDGQLGLGHDYDQTSPVMINTDEAIVKIAASPRNSYLIGVSGNLYAAGSDASGLLGTNSSSTTFFELIPSTSFSSISVSSSLALALDNTGQVWAWGQSGFSQAPNGNTPSVVTLSEEIIEVKAGGFHALALGASSNLYGWGKNSHEQLGAFASIVNQPELIDTNVLDFDAGREHSLILRNDIFKALGRNQVAQLGNGDSFSKLETLNITDVKIISTGAYHNMAINAQGAISAWGHNDLSQLDSSGNNTLLPTTITSTSLSVLNHNTPSTTTSENLNLSIEAIGSGTPSLQSQLIFSPNPSASLSFSNSTNPHLEAGTPGRYVILVESTNANYTSKRIISLYVKPSVYGEMIWGQNTWNQGEEPTVDLR